VEGLERYAVVSCHVERPLDDRTWTAFLRLLRHRPAGFVVTPFMRPPDRDGGEDEDVWLGRARAAAMLAPLGHHTHWGGATQARPLGDVDAASIVRAEAEWLRARDLSPRFFCGGGWYIDEPLAETLAALDYVDCTATTFRQSYLAENAPRLQLDGPAQLALPTGAALLELPATHSLGMIARGLFTLRGLVHVHFHDWELVDVRRRAALGVVLRLLARFRKPLPLDELAAAAAHAPRLAWSSDTIKP